MLGWEDRVYKNIKDLYWIVYDSDLFTYVRIEPNLPLVQDWDKEKHWIKDEDIKEIHFLYVPMGKVLKIPYQNRIDFQKFLSSWQKWDFPKNLIW
jgi:hypothetical protein